METSTSISYKSHCTRKCVVSLRSRILLSRSALQSWIHSALLQHKVCARDSIEQPSMYSYVTSERPPPCSLCKAKASDQYSTGFNASSFCSFNIRWPTSWCWAFLLTESWRLLQSKTSAKGKPSFSPDIFIGFLQEKLLFNSDWSSNSPVHTRVLPACARWVRIDSISTEIYDWPLESARWVEPYLSYCSPLKRYFEFIWDYHVL